MALSKNVVLYITFKFCFGHFTPKITFSWSKSLCALETFFDRCPKSTKWGDLMKKSGDSLVRSNPDSCAQGKGCCLRIFFIKSIHHPDDEKIQSQQPLPCAHESGFTLLRIPYLDPAILMSLTSLLFSVFS